MRFHAHVYPWADGQFYVWDETRSSICNPDTGRCDSPWRQMFILADAEAAATQLNELEDNHAMAALMYAARRAWLDETALIG